jgi:CRISPR-associated exonuclease Cas4
VLLAGRVDALAVVDGRITAALDWKSDIAPTHEQPCGTLVNCAILRGTGTPHGALVDSSLGEVVWLTT